ncbi:MAG: tetratricopeptide repeat protein [Hyphomonadaceae bacterium]|nr:tetratricopeptide repeat protein [Hyphomonadaceae bacterium]
MTNETDTFVQEVNEGLRQDRVLQFLRKYGPVMAGVAIVLVLGLVGWVVWTEQRQQTARAQSVEYYAALQLAAEGNLDGAKTEFARLREEGPRTYQVMARMEHAALLQEQGDLEAALAEFEAAAESANDPLMRDTALLRAAYIAAETQDFTALQQRLQPLAQSDSRLSFLARELLGVEAWEAGETQLARETFEALSLAFDAPEAVQQRAQLALAVLGPAPASASEAPAAPAPSEGETK